MAPKAQKSSEEAMQSLPDNYKNATNVLLASLDELEVMLEPLMSAPNSLSETLAKLDTEKRCQLELLMAYAINTFAYINLRTNGTAPATHPVMHELKRIKIYTEKLRHATQGNNPNMNVDKDAAARFIRGALAANEVADKKAAAEAEEDSADSPRTHMRFGEDEGKEEEKEKKGSSSNATGSASTRKRVMDPFHGYDDGKKKSKSG